MSRSNGSQPQSAAQALQAAAYDVNPDPRAWNPQQPNPAAQQGYGAQPRPGAQPAPAADYGYAPQGPTGHTDPYAQHGGYYQSPAQPQTYAAVPAPQRAPLQASPATHYAPQFDPYVPANPAPQASAQAYQPALSSYQVPVGAQHAANAYPDLRGQDARGADIRGQDLRGTLHEPSYDQWAGHPQQADPRGYDLASYGGHDPHSPYGAAHQQPAARAPAAQDWGQPQTNGYAQQGYDPYQQAPAHQPAAYGQQAYAPQDQAQGAAYDETYAGEDTGEPIDEASPRGRRGFMIAATLAGAIFVGGGLTYAYNALLGPSAGGPPPIVKNDASPSKVKPSDPGGKQFAHADSKVMGRLNDGGSSGDVDASGSKKVSTLVVKPDGTIEAPALAEAAPAAATGSAVGSVPGLSIVSVPDTPPPAAAAASTAAVALAKPVMDLAMAQKPIVVSPPAAAPKTPVVISAAIAAASAVPAAASSLVETSAVDTSAAAAAPAAKKPTAVKKVAAVTSPAVAGAAAQPAPTGAGYMAVIASMPASAKSRMDALTRWADMQQKYGSVLQGKTMDVQEANLGEKGTYHRLLVGPPSSKDTANSLCSQLKAAGHADCWVMAY